MNVHRVTLPLGMGQRYFDSHYRFLIETAKAAELMIEYRK